MEYTVAQVAADPSGVADALATLAPTWRDGTGMVHSRGWTSVRMDRAAAVRAAPLLTRRLERSVLIWTVDPQRCGVSFFLPNGDVVEASSDQADQVDELAKLVRSDHVPAGEDGLAADPAQSPDDRHRAIAELLGVPHLVPARDWQRHATTRTPTDIRPSPADAVFRRHQRIRSARGWLRFAEGLGLVAIVLLALRGPWLGIPVAAAVILVAEGIRHLLGRSLPRYQRA
jgi:hypothetical protein